MHSGPESTRHSADVEVSPKDLEETYLPAFRATVTEAHAQSLMCAYNAVDGAPACANRHLLGDILRGAWGFDGFVTSDCGAIGDIADGHKYAKDVEHASVDAVRAGTDTSCRTEYDSLTQAVHDGLIQESELDVAVKRLFRARFRLGMFDPAADVPDANIPCSEVNSAAHAELALQAARESMVLLKNAGNVLPLKKSIRTVAVIEPNAASLAALEGNYNAIPLHPVNPLDGLRTALAGRAKVIYAQGSAYVDPLRLPVAETALQTHGQPGLRGEYFPNTTFSGPPALVRTDRQIEFDWYDASQSIATRHPSRYFAFGEGLSFTRFVYTRATLAASRIDGGKPVRLSVHVENAGLVDGDEVVQVYLTPASNTTASAPLRSLVAFTRVHLAAHEGRDLNLTINPRQLSQVDAAGHRAILPGRYLISVGGQHPDGKMPSLLLKIEGRSEMPE